MRNVVLFSFILLFALLIFCANRTIKSEERSWIVNEAQSFYYYVKANEHVWPVSALHLLQLFPIEYSTISST